VAELWAYRELLFFLVWRDLKVRYKQTVVGIAWAVIQPFGTMVVFSLFFGRLARIPSEGLPYPIFFYSALVPWMYFAAAVQSATNVMVENQRVITKVYFPRVLLPVAAVLAGLVDFAIAGTVLVGMALYYGIVPGTAVLTLPLFVLLTMLTALGVGLWLSALNVMYRDVRYVLPFLIQFWMFVSPVAYPTSLVPERWRWLYGLNPMAGVIEAFRGVFNGAPAPAVVGASVVTMLALLLGGLAFFQSVEGTLVDVA
jgi:lipopolysaccharide transport system permease protein